MRKILSTVLATTALMTVNAYAQDREPLTVGLSTWVGYGLLHLAEEKGFFDENGVDVSLVTVQDKPSTAAAIATGRMDGWATTVDTFIFYNAQRIGLQQVLAVDFSNGGEGLIATGDIEKVEDLRGRTVGAEEGSSTYFFLLNVLADHGMTIADVQLQSMRAGDAGAAFSAGRIDAAATWDPWLSKAAERGGQILVSTKDKPGLIVDTVAFRTSVLEERPQDVAGFLKGYFEAYDYWTAHPDESNGIMAEALGIDEAEFTTSLAGLEFASRERNEAYIGTADKLGQIGDVTQRGIDFYAGLGILKDPVDAARIVNTQPLASVLAP